jgi:rhodanese-related sulfurtransferase
MKERGETNFMKVLIAFCVAISLVLIVFCVKRRRQNRDLESHSITPEALHTLMNANHEVLLFDVRRPLDLLIDLESIPGSTRIPPKDFFENPSLVPMDKETVFYCTCPGDETARRIVRQALRMGFSCVKLLRGGLPAWKAKGYSVVTYDKPFHLEIRT